MTWTQMESPGESPVPAAAAPPEPADEDAVIRLENVTVRYHVPRERVSSFKEYAIRRLRGRFTSDDFWALREVNLTVRRGEVLGIIGRNGAGKSTLLKVVARVLRPTTGRVWVKGRVAPLLEVGAGFHAELVGRENVYLNATLLGHSSKQIDARFSAIVDFAELWDFIDAPLRTYSTGMVARLGFAVATAWEPDILLLDEVLAVGDGAFQHKCLKRIEGFHWNGTTVLLVSHDMETVRSMCRRVVWVEHGYLRAIGTADEVTALYEASTQASGVAAPP
jgi:ABC-2 type transport system ATP-binding protein